MVKMAIEIVRFSMKHGDFPFRYVELPEGILNVKTVWRLKWVLHQWIWGLLTFRRNLLME